MQTAGGWLLAAALLAGSACGLAHAAEGPGAKEAVSVVMTPEVARDVARRALEQRKYALAAEIAAELVARDPQDPQALMLLSAASTRSGQPERGWTTGKQAFRHAQTRGQRFEAAYLTAEALSHGKYPILSKLWLRRADMYAASPEEHDGLRAAFGQLEARTRLHGKFSLAVGPTDNVNGGSLHDSFDYWGIPIPIAQALPGWSAVAQGQMSYDLMRSKDRQLAAFAIAMARKSKLGDEALELMPGARGEDFDQSSLRFGLSGQQMLRPDTAANASVALGRRWYGGEHLLDEAILSFGMTRAFENRKTVGLQLAVTATDVEDRPVANSVETRLGLRHDLPVGNGRLSFGFDAILRQSDAAGVANRALSIQADWTPPELFNGVDMNVFARVEGRDYWKTPGRSPDMLVDMGLSASFENLSIYGFAPTVGLAASRSVSDVVVRDTMNVGVTISLSSSF